jgi:uncharacterized protein YndB with AHSA1/START domain
VNRVGRVGAASREARLQLWATRPPRQRNRFVIRLRAVQPVTVATLISAPREQVFDYLQDIANHPEFTDHYLVDWRLTRERSIGRGAGARFRVKAPGSRFSWADSTFVDVQRPRLIVEAGRTGKNNRIRTLATYELSQGPSGTTRVQFTLEAERSTFLSDRIFAALGQHAWLKRKNEKAMRRLRSIIERGEGRGQRVTVASG